MQTSFVRENAVQPRADIDTSPLKGKSVIITGGASGLGEEMARQFVRAGAFVTIADLSVKNGERVVSELGGENHAAFAQCDVTDWQSQLNAFKTAVARSPTKQIDIVVANAGVGGDESIWKADAPTPDADPIEPSLITGKINFLGPQYTAKLATHYLCPARNKSATPRSLIFTCSMSGYGDQPYSPEYNASKWGVRGLLRSLRCTNPKYGIRTNGIAPTFVKTGILETGWMDFLLKGGMLFAEKEDVGRAVMCIAADGEMNGRMLAVLPRGVMPEAALDFQSTEHGYVDLMRDDFNEGDTFTTMNKLAMKLFTPPAEG